MAVGIGINTGVARVGNMGSKRKFKYGPLGNTVNLASRMESHSTPGRIQVSQAVMERLTGRFVFEPRGLIDVKGKGPMPTWFLLGPAGHVVTSPAAGSPPLARQHRPCPAGPERLRRGARSGR